MTHTTRPNPLLDAALAYATRGWAVFPCHTPTPEGCSCLKRDACADIGKHPRTKHGLKDASTDERTLRRWWHMWPAANIAIATGAASGMVVLDIDPLKGGIESLVDLEQSYHPLPDTVMQLTGNGVHYLFAHPGRTTKNGVQTLGAGLDIRGDGGYIIAAPSLHANGKQYAWEICHEPEETPLTPMPDWLIALLQTPATAPIIDVGEPIGEGHRNDTLFRVGSGLRRRGLTEAVILAALREMNTTQCSPPLDDADVVKIVTSIAKYPPGPPDGTYSQNGSTPGVPTTLSSLSSLSSQGEGESGTPDSTPPTTLSSLSSLSSQRCMEIREEAYYGVAGEVVRTIGPHSEADPVALLIQFHAKFGVLVGRGPFYRVESTKHYPNIFATLVGPTGKGRKGTAYDNVEFIMETVDPSWTLKNVIGGCGSGEGLINAVRDPVMKHEPIKVKGKIAGYEDVLADPGIVDKRLLVYESEFASVLKVVSRDGNILSMTLRQAWESGNLQNSVKTAPQKATNAHIAVIGHITTDELRKLLTTTEAANGFGNRFLWLYVKRSKSLPDGGALSSVDMQPLIEKLRKAHRSAIKTQRMTRDAEASVAWHAVYDALSEGKPGLPGAILARGEAQVLRLSMLYALLDCSSIIRAEHLYAALAVWEYVEASVTDIFGATTGNREADTLYEALKGAKQGRMSRWEIVKEVFHGHIKAYDLNEAIRTLVDAGCVTREYEATVGRRKEYICYGANIPNGPTLMRARANYIEQAKLAVATYHDSHNDTIPCEESEESEESLAYRVETHDAKNASACEESSESEESPYGDLVPDTLYPEVDLDDLTF